MEGGTPTRISNKDPLTTSILGAPHGGNYDVYVRNNSVDQYDGHERPGVTYRVYRARWHMMAIFCAVTLTNAFIWIVFSPIEPYTSVYYGVSETWVNMLSGSFMILYLPGSAIGLWMLNKYGLRLCIVAGAVLNLISGWLRYTSVFIPGPGGYAMLLFGQCLAAMAQPLFTNTPTKVRKGGGRAQHGVEGHV